MSDTIKKIMSEYAKNCLNGTIPVGQYIKFACERHLSDLSRKDIYFDEDKAARVVSFVEMMRHVKGALTGRPIKLEPWQIFFVGSLFGWYCKDTKIRRFREGHMNVCRKNAKSTLAAALAHYCLVADGELGAECMLAAAKEAQAKDIFGIALQMVNMNPNYKKTFNLKTTSEVIRYERTGSHFTFCIGIPTDGGNYSLGIVDEYHEHRSNAAYDAIKTGQGARLQPILIIISTAGMNFKCDYKRYLDYCHKVSSGVLEDDSLFSLEYTLDDGDDWQDFSLWKKGNPNMGVSIYENYLYDQYKKAMSDVASRSAILTKHCNVWNNASTNWIDMAHWQQCGDSNLNMDDFAGENCWLGLDLASRVDLCSLIIIFRKQNKYYVFGKHYMNSERVQRTENHHYRAWKEQGWLTVTEGTQTDFSAIEADLKLLGTKFNIQEIAYDPREATYLMQHIREWASFPCVEVSQSPQSFSEPMKVLEAAYLSGTLCHANDPVINWAASNVILKNTSNKIIYPAKRNEEDKIDPIVAMIMALGRAELVHKEADFSIFIL